MLECRKLTPYQLTIESAKCPVRPFHGASPGLSEEQKNLVELLQQPIQSKPKTLGELEQLYQQVVSACQLGLADLAFERCVIPNIWNGIEWRSVETLNARVEREMQMLDAALQIDINGAPRLRGKNLGFALGQRGILHSLKSESELAVESLIQATIILDTHDPLLAAHFGRELSLHYMRRGMYEVAQKRAFSAAHAADRAVSHLEPKSRGRDEVECHYSTELILWYRNEGCRGLDAYLASFVPIDTGIFRSVEDPIFSALKLVEEVVSLTPEKLRARGLSGFLYADLLFRVGSAISRPEVFDKIIAVSQNALAQDEADGRGAHTLAYDYLSLALGRIGKGCFQGAEDRFKLAEEALGNARACWIKSRRDDLRVPVENIISILKRAKFKGSLPPPEREDCAVS